MKRVMIVLLLVSLLLTVGNSAQAKADAARATHPDVPKQPVLALTCPGFLPSRLVVGLQARVTPGPSNTLRSHPGGWAIGLMPGGAVFSVLDGPQCVRGMAWWRVNYLGQIGWTAEGYGNTYWLEPLNGCAITLPPRLMVGRWARVTPGLPNLLRSGPSTAYPVLARLPGGSVFLVLNGPHCSNGMAWWQVSYQGAVGWTAEGRGYTYWTTPLG
ncbi:MAG: SH3 domain-containing protein [Anaerolineae bacterium]|nr:SH3 domain-containing protein [Anaerolineae bacterium]